MQGARQETAWRLCTRNEVRRLGEVGSRRRRAACLPTTPSLSPQHDLGQTAARTDDGRPARAYRQQPQARLPAAGHQPGASSPPPTRAACRRVAHEGIRLVPVLAGRPDAELTVAPAAPYSPRSQAWLAETLAELLARSPDLSRQLQVKGCHQALLRSHLGQSTAAGTGFPPALVDTADDTEPLHDQLVFKGIKGCLVMVVGITEVRRRAPSERALASAPCSSSRTLR